MKAPSKAATLREISKMLCWLKDLTAYITFEDYLMDEELRMDVYRVLTIVGIESDRIAPLADNGAGGVEMDGLKGFGKADFLHGLGQDHYAVWSLLKNDLPYFLEKISKAGPAMQEKIPARLSA